MVYVTYLATLSVAQTLNSNYWNREKEIGKEKYENFEDLI